MKRFILTGLFLLSFINGSVQSADEIVGLLIFREFSPVEQTVHKTNPPGDCIAYITFSPPF